MSQLIAEMLEEVKAENKLILKGLETIATFMEMSNVLFNIQEDEILELEARVDELERINRDQEDDGR